jgi:zinc/manganese transport system ATP-binding protein
VKNNTSSISAASVATNQQDIIDASRAMGDSTTVIAAHKLAAGYRGRRIWQGADFAVNKGEFVGVLGPNGAGKTTLFRLLLGLLRPTNGSLQVLGDAPHRGDARIGYVPQRRPIDADMNVEALELVRLGLSGQKWGMVLPAKSRLERAQALAALKLVDGKELARRPLGKLSGGELQRVFLAQALVGKPDLLLLDEPLANMDIRREASLVQVIDRIVRTQNIAVMLIAHNLNPLLPVLDRIMYVANGKVVSGLPGEVITTETLSALYGAPVEVLHDSHGRVAVLGVEEAAHPHGYHE